MLIRVLFLGLLTSCGMRVIASGDSAAVHEWGTFTSVAGEDGSAISWMPLSGPSDLPCFVHHLDQRNLKVAEYGTVRMETPVMYFYPLKPTVFSIHVKFPNGRVTEWYPQASRVQPSTSRSGWIDWNDVHVNNSGDRLPKLGAASHYYAARETDAWPLRSENENEKLLFYRGIADFGVDVKPIVHGDNVEIRNDGPERIPIAFVFENRAGHIGYRVVRRLREPVSVNYADLSGNMDSLRSTFESELIEMGLYRKEAHAMLETWRDSWFEEGLRVFYILPRTKVDALLPVTIDPAPEQLARVFVGRVELLSPTMRQEISVALQNGDVPILAKYGRFLNAFIQEMNSSRSNLPTSERASQFLQNSYVKAVAESLKRFCGE